MHICNKNALLVIDQIKNPFFQPFCKHFLVSSLTTKNGDHQHFCRRVALLVQMNGLLSNFGKILINLIKIFQFLSFLGHFDKFDDFDNLRYLKTPKN